MFNHDKVYKTDGKIRGWGGWVLSQPAPTHPRKNRFTNHLTYQICDKSNRVNPQSPQPSIGYDLNPLKPTLSGILPNNVRGLMDIVSPLPLTGK